MSVKMSDLIKAAFLLKDALLPHATEKTYLYAGKTKNTLHVTDPDPFEAKVAGEAVLEQFDVWPYLNQIVLMHNIGSTIVEWKNKSLVRLRLQDDMALMTTHLPKITQSGHAQIDTLAREGIAHPLAPEITANLDKMRNPSDPVSALRKHLLTHPDTKITQALKGTQNAVVQITRSDYA